MTEIEKLGDFRITADHPALAGHFPGNPLVPGAVLLDRALSLLEASGHAPVSVVTQAKFTGIVRPEETCSVGLSRGRHGPALEVRVGARLVMTARVATP